MCFLLRMMEQYMTIYIPKWLDYDYDTFKTLKEIMHKTLKYFNYINICKHLM